MSSYTLRVRVLLSAFCLIALVVITKLYLLQVVHGGEYAARASRQAVRPQAGVFQRGTISFTDRTGKEIAAATLKTGYTLALKPTDIADPQALYEKISGIVPLDKASFMAKASKPKDPYEEVAHRLTETQAAALQKLKLPGVIIESEQWRYYPGKSLAAEVIGFVAYDEDTQRGRYGLERYYDDVLGSSEDSLYVNFFAEVFSSAKQVLGSESDARGDLITTIEPSVQQELERQLAEIHAQWHPTKAGGIIMDPKTGEIVAMGAYPSFDLNEFGAADPAAYANPLVQDIYEMGSIIKPLTMAAGLDSGAVTAATTYNDRGFVEVDGATIRNFDGKGRGVVPMQEVLSQSLNTGVSFVVERMGNDLFSDYMRRYGLGDETGIDLPGELAGHIDNLKSPRKVEHFTASFGQGIAITPIETVRALASLGNGGLLVTPHVVRAIRTKTGVVRTLAQPEPVRVIKPETSHEISRMLTVVVDKALANGTVKIEHTSVAAKTGTAQIANPATGKYFDDRYLHSFFGYFPSYDPKFIIFLYAYEPKNVNFASQTLTQPFHELTKFLINYYEIPPDR
jgi:stage V sporulation protein D (sporulation-specific penicillin-binding protein)